MPRWWSTYRGCSERGAQGGFDTGVAAPAWPPMTMLSLSASGREHSGLGRFAGRHGWGVVVGEVGVSITR